MGTRGVNRAGRNPRFGEIGGQSSHTSEQRACADDGSDNSDNLVEHHVENETVSFEEFES